MLNNQHRHSTDSVSNYRLYALKLTNPCGNAQRSIVKRSHQQIDNGQVDIKTYLKLAKQSFLPHNSLGMILNLAEIAKQLSEKSNKEEDENVFNEKERSRRETEVDVEEFLLRKTELRNLLSGLQTMIGQHVLQVAKV